MVKQFTYRGLSQKELEGLSLEKLLKLLPARARRSLTRGVDDSKRKLIAEIKSKLSERLFEIYLRKPYDFHLQTNSAQLMRNVNDIERFTQVMIALLMLITEVIIVFGVGTLLLFYEPVGAIASIIVLSSVGFIFHKRVQKKINRWGKERQIHDGSRLMHLQQGFGAIKDIKILQRSNELIKTFTTN